MKIVLGTLNFDYASVSESFDNKKVVDFLVTAYGLGIRDIDTAYYYKSAEKMLGDSGHICQFNVSSKANPWYNNDFTNGQFGELSRSGISHQLRTSLSNTGLDRFTNYFMHSWDHQTPIEESLGAFDEFYRKELFDNFGVSNISSEQLQSILDTCEKNHYIAPKVYQGMYNVYCRKVEEIFPTLRDCNIQFEAYNPLAGGLLTGKYYGLVDDPVEPSRYCNNEIYTSIFWNDKIIPETRNITADISLRWLRSHSLLTHSDSIVIGCSKLEHLVHNTKSIQDQTPLNTSEMDTLGRFYEIAKEFQANYFY
ncbi:MAG: hypothetical protein EBU90_10325 [Proteobacteria bacterium]|nr:hypothetical protein [Pseudomonadota bacterium]NBP13805.1 hypothetical protein [bacterium]